MIVFVAFLQIFYATARLPRPILMSKRVKKMQASQAQAKNVIHDTSADSQLRRLTIGAIGVVYGDIGTSPIYTLRESLKQVVPDGQIAPRDDVLGILSLILWSLLLIPTIKYVTILLRVDNHGEGGTLALMAMARSVVFRNTTIFLLFGMMGAGLFYGDAILTPALSVLSALEGLEVVTPAFTPYIMPITLAIIVALFLFQKTGTDKVSVLFGPVCALWFAVLAATGIHHIQDEPSILLSFSPTYAAHFLFAHGRISFIALGCVFLAVTGAEALYADLGHFGKKPIRNAWLWFVLPCLALNYLGQGAMVLHEPATLDNPFFKLVPHEWMAPLVFITTLATIIASQAVITGAFSLTKQAVNLGLLPRMEIRHTSAAHSGQIYVPQVNYIIMLGVIALVLMFRTSGNMAAAYGISITGTMVLTAIMAFFVIWQVWGWSLTAALALMVPFFIIDCVFLGANMMKVFEGGWVTLAVAAVMVVTMITWTKGSFILNSRSRKRALPVEKFVRDYRTIFPDIVRVRGCAIFFAADPARTPASLQQNLRHNKVLHDRNIILSVKVEPIPYVDAESRAVITHLSGDFSTVLLRFGFQETP
ncbi:MAG: potassium transporter Kup, partial [Alphaproteobacteria bacterium]